MAGSLEELPPSKGAMGMGEELKTRQAQAFLNLWSCGHTKEIEQSKVAKQRHDRPAFEHVPPMVHDESQEHRP